jgi:multidrug efflux pump subunit AcrA (membrane-fusion protein)
MISKFKHLILGHKLISVVAAVVVVGGGYYWYSASQGTVSVTKYVVEKATQGTVVASVAGSGQVQAVTQIDVKPKNTAAVTRVYVKVGDPVKAGQLLIQLDTTNEAKALKQAQLSLQSSELALTKLQQSADQLSLTQDQNAVVQAQEQLLSASTTLAKDYQNGFDSVSSAFVDFQTVMSALQDFTLGTEVVKGQNNPDAFVNLMPTYLQGATSPYRDDIVTRYATVITAYQADLAAYHAAGRYSDTATLDALFLETYNTAKLMGEAVKSAKSMMDFMTTNYPKNVGLAPLPSIVTTFQTSFGNYTGTVNNDIVNLSNAGNNVVSDRTALNDAQLSLTEKQQTLAKLQAGADPLDIQSQQLSIQQQQFSVQTAQQSLDDDSIRAPIDGVVSAMPSAVGATVPSPAVSIVGSGEVAQITLNEVDATKVATGDKATLAFDAVSGLSLAGQVAEIDPVGTVTQGVVNYNVKVSFIDTTGTSTSTAQVRPGMSVSASIVSQVHQDVIAVPNAAIARQGTATYVLEPATPLADADISASANGGILLPATNRVTVTTGLANDSVTEVTSGLNVGDQIVVQTIKSSSAAAATPARSGNVLGNIFGGGGGARVGTGGAVRGN